MQINLRKANAIQTEIRRAINDIKLTDNVTVTEFTQDVEGLIGAAELEFVEAINRKLELSDALYQIRAEVGRVNAGSGVNDVLAQIQAVESKITIKNKIINLNVRKELTEINARIVKMKQNPSSERASLYGDRFNNVESGVVSKDYIKTAIKDIKDLKRTKQTLSEKLLQLNVNSTINLSDKTKAVLMSEGIL